MSVFRGARSGDNRGPAQEGRRHHLIIGIGGRFERLPKRPDARSMESLTVIMDASAGRIGRISG